MTLKFFTFLDFNSYFFSTQKKVHKFFGIGNLISSSLKDYSENENLVFYEAHTIDMRETFQTRKLYSLDDVFTKVGGVLHDVKALFAFIFCNYS